MRIKNFKAVYIIGVAVALASLLVPGANNTAHAQLNLPTTVDDLTRLPGDLEVDRRLRSRIERRKSNATRLAESWIDTAELTVEQTARQATGLANGLLRQLQIAKDPSGADIEARTVVILVENDLPGGIIQPGFEVVAKRNMSSLGLTMYTLRLPKSEKLSRAIRDLRKANPDAEIDYNHLYDLASESSQQRVTGTDDAVANTTPAQSSKLRIGIIDSAVMLEHRAIAGVDIVARDFATAPGVRPETHGTAIASLVAISSKQQATVYSASVFFQVPNRAPGATAESLVAALDWMVEQQVDVINMSLAGPGNHLLETAIARLMKMDAVVVAAVGNNGPRGDPLYPAAYEGVIGVTAVDRNNKIFRYANRGEQVEIAARGVDVKVADSLSGGWRIESGTSMASPRVAVIVAKLLRHDMIQASAVASWLTENAEDLGRKGFDKVYGHGLITQLPIYARATGKSGG